MLTNYANPAEKLIADPNQDVVYGLGFLSLEKEPVVVQAPDFGDRFWTFPIYDARTDQISQLGLQYGTKPGFYMIVGPNWKGRCPSWHCRRGALVHRLRCHHAAHLHGR